MGNPFLPSDRLRHGMMRYGKPLQRARRWPPPFKNTNSTTRWRGPMSTPCCSLRTSRAFMWRARELMEVGLLPHFTRHVCANVGIPKPKRLSWSTGCSRPGPPASGNRTSLFIRRTGMPVAESLRSTKCFTILAISIWTTSAHHGAGFVNPAFLIRSSPKTTALGMSRRALGGGTRIPIACWPPAEDGWLGYAT